MPSTRKTETNIRTPPAWLANAKGERKKGSAALAHERKIEASRNLLSRRIVAVLAHASTKKALSLSEQSKPGKATR